jgi:flagellin-like protein
MDESAVSESVGVILMVAITVVLAAIIAAFAFGLIENVPLSKNIMLTVDKPTISTITVTYLGGLDQKDLTSFIIIWPQGLPDTYNNPKVGDIYPPNGEYRNITPGAQNHIVVVGHFIDNTEQVLINTFA